MSKKMQDGNHEDERVDQEPLKSQSNQVDQQQNQPNDNTQNAREKPELKPSRIQTRSK